MRRPTTTAPAPESVELLRGIHRRLGCLVWSAGVLWAFAVLGFLARLAIR